LPRQGKLSPCARDRRADGSVNLSIENHKMNFQFE